MALAATKAEAPDPGVATLELRNLGHRKAAQQHPAHATDEVSTQSQPGGGGREPELRPECRDRRAPGCPWERWDTSEIDAQERTL